jgi:hypothetical protein
VKVFSLCRDKSYSLLFRCESNNNGELLQGTNEKAFCEHTSLAENVNPTSSFLSGDRSVRQDGLVHINQSKRWGRQVSA